MYRYDEAPDTAIAAPGFLRGGGEMGERMRSQDWSSSSLGDPGSWPQPLRTSVKLLLNTGHPMYIFWGRDGACLYNDAYRQLIGAERHPASLGLPAREVWAEIWPLIGLHVEQVMAGGEATWNVDALVPITRNGRREDVYWTYSYSPILDDDAPARVGGVLVLCTETTQRVLAEQRVRHQAESYQRLFEQAPGFICILKSPGHIFEFVNLAYVKLVGDRSFLGRPVVEVLPEIEAQGFIALLDRVYATGERYIAYGMSIQMDRGSGVAEERFVDFIYAPVFDESGQVSGIFVEGHDVTEAHLLQQSEQRQGRRLRLLVDELNHRVKNTLAIVQGLARQTFRGSEEMTAANATFSGRLFALAAAHDVLTTEHWEDADLGDIFRETLKAHANGPGRCRVEGPVVRVSPQTAVTFAMVTHELATNAHKYGALSAESGWVDLTWHLLGRHLVVRWEERGGPVVVVPANTGFGSKMIKRALAGEPGGSVILDFAPAGVVCELSVSLPTQSPAVEFAI